MLTNKTREKSKYPKLSDKEFFYFIKEYRSNVNTVLS